MSRCYLCATISVRGALYSKGIGLVGGSLNNLYLKLVGCWPMIWSKVCGSEALCKHNNSDVISFRLLRVLHISTFILCATWILNSDQVFLVCTAFIILFTVYVDCCFSFSRFQYYYVPTFAFCLIMWIISVRNASEIWVITLDFMLSAGNVIETFLLMVACMKQTCWLPHDS